LPPSAPSAAARVVVSDAGPLIALGRLDLLALLPKVFARVQVPTAVLEECMARPDNADASRIRLAVDRHWLVACDAVPIVQEGLDPGECAAIARALEIGAGLLADDRAARHYALQVGLHVIGTLGVLVLAKRAGHVAAVKPLIERLRAGGQRLSHAAVSQALAAADEAAD
jgi:predicted nucleic acid-binding protein